VTCYKAVFKTWGVFKTFTFILCSGPCTVKPDGSLDLSYYGVDTGLYHTHLERWYRHFNRDQVHTFTSQLIIGKRGGNFSFRAVKACAHIRLRGSTALLTKMCANFKINIYTKTEPFLWHSSMSQRFTVFALWTRTFKSEKRPCGGRTTPVWIPLLIYQLSQ
jgi:hypothetical protein